MLHAFLENKPLYYDEIDYSLMPRVYESIKAKITLPKIIHILGTNGKGTTGRFLASALDAQGYNVGHYTSPHIFKLNERIWLNAQDVDDRVLEEAHRRLLLLLKDEYIEKLSYFEYTTFLALIIFEQCDYVVLEAGLGGEYDATAVFENIVTVVTPIDKDHEAFLGDTISDIAKTKLNAIRSKAILAKQKHSEVYEVAQTIARDKRVDIYKYEDNFDTNDRENLDIIAKKLRLAIYLQENLALAIATLNLLNIKYTIENFYNSQLFGRLTKLDEHIILDVGHNELAAQRVVESLKEEKYILVYNSYRDKNYEVILSILKPIILHVEIIDVDDVRVESKELLSRALQKNNIEYKNFDKIHKGKNYLVFGSFSVARAFLKVYSG